MRQTSQEGIPGKIRYRRFHAVMQSSGILKIAIPHETAGSGSLPHYLRLYTAWVYTYCTAGNFRQWKISSIATTRQFVRNLFSSNAGRRSFALCSFGRHSLLIVYFRIHEYFWSHTCGWWKYLARNLISQKIALMKATKLIKFLTKISCYTVLVYFNMLTCGVFTLRFSSKHAQTGTEKRWKRLPQFAYWTVRDTPKLSGFFFLGLRWTVKMSRMYLEGQNYNNNSVFVCFCTCVSFRGGESFFSSVRYCRRFSRQRGGGACRAHRPVSLLRSCQLSGAQTLAEGHQRSRLSNLPHQQCEVHCLLAFQAVSKAAQPTTGRREIDKPPKLLFIDSFHWTNRWAC